MNIKQSTIQIEDNSNPFSECKLDRQKYAETLTEIILKYPEGFVLALNNTWGTGKTTFVKMWNQYLLNEGFKTLYFNAWENDFEDNPFIAFISELKSLINTEDTKEQFNNLITKASPLAKNLALGILKTQITKYVGEEFANYATNINSNDISPEIQMQINKYENKKKSILEFHESLKNFVSNASNDKPIVVIIDEMDRCRPDYSVKLLEQIKHLFNVYGIIFILSIDKVQLGNAVRGVYGSNLIDAEEYLRRFIDIDFSLPNTNTDNFCDYLYEYFEFDQFFNNPNRLQYPDLRNDASNFLSFSKVLFDSHDTTLRIQERVFAHCRIVIDAFETNEYSFPDLLLFLIFIKYMHPKIYNEVKEKKITYQELIDKVEKIISNVTINEDNLNSFIRAESFLLLFYHNYLKRSHYSVNLFTTDEQDPTSAKLIVTSNIDNQKLNQFTHHLMDYARNNTVSLDFLLNKIDLTQTVSIKGK